MPEYLDPSLETLLVDTLAERAERVPASVTLERVQARLVERQRRHRRLSVRKPLALLGLAAAVMLPLAAFVAGQRPSEPVPAPTDPYQALIRRGEGDAWLVVAMRGDGQERVITSVPVPDPADDRRRPPMAVSLHGDWGATIQYFDERRPAAWRTVTLDDMSSGGTVNATLGDLDLGWRDGDWWREDGSRLQLCDMAVRQECPGLPNGSVIVETPDGSLTPGIETSSPPTMSSTPSSVAPACGSCSTDAPTAGRSRWPAWPHRATRARWRHGTPDPRRWGRAIPRVWLPMTPSWWPTRA